MLAAVKWAIDLTQLQIIEYMLNIPQAIKIGLAVGLLVVKAR
jgi:hypothetical protein